METKSRKMKFTDLKDMLKQTGEAYGDRPAYIFKTEEKEKFKTITHKEFRDEINALGTVLINMGLKDKRIAVISENRYEWELSYLFSVRFVLFYLYYFSSDFISDYSANFYPCIIFTIL